jgi:general secretion pathway protein A
VLIIDEAQNLSADVLEQLRLLTNLETNERKLLQIILIGQPELRTMLARPELEQLAQRVIARYHLGSLSEAETGSYIAHRLAVAGAGAGNPFPRSLVPRIHRLAHGVPRRINLLCVRALLGAYVENSPHVTRTILLRAADEVFAGQPGQASSKARWPLVAAALLAGAAVSAAAAWQMRPPAAAPAPVKAAARPLKPAAPKVVAPALPIAHADEQAALRELAALWGEPLAEGEDACQAALRINLRCYQGRGGLYELRLLDRPAILTLRDGAAVSHAVLGTMDDSTLTLRVAGKVQKIDAGALATRFDGAYTTFYRVPRAFREQVAAGEQGPDADWIAARLAEVNQLPAPPANQPFNARTRDQLRSFQAQQNLKADGVAGPRTYMRLNQLSGVAEPHLLAAKTGKP